MGEWHIFPQEPSKGLWCTVGLLKGLVRIARLSQRWKGPGSLQASECHGDMNTLCFPIYTEILIVDACQKSQSHTSCIPSQPSDSSQACQVALNKHKFSAQMEMLTRDMDVNEEEQQSFIQKRNSTPGKIWTGGGK